MSKTRKILSVVLALVMAVSMLAIGASAGYEAGENATNYTQTWALSEPVDNGDGTYSVDVSLTTNYPTGAIQFVVTNSDSTVATLKDAKLGSAIPAAYGATINKSASKGKVVIIPTTTEDTITAQAIDGVVATLTYTYSGSGSANIAIENSPKSETNVNGSLIAARMSDGDVVTGDMITGQKVISVGETRTIGGSAAVPPTLAVVEGTGGVIDTDRTELNVDGDTVTGYIYGVEPENYESVTDVFEVTGDGSIEVVANDAGSEAGTGTIVNVLDADGEVVETYVLVIFGDIDGDGAITADDAAYIELHAAYMYYENDCSGQIESPVVLFAADVDISEDASADDASYVELSAAYMYYENDAEGKMLQSTIIGLM